MATGNVHRYDNTGREEPAGTHETGLDVWIGPRPDPAESDRVKIVKAICNTVGWLGFCGLLYLVFKMLAST